jgi:hypothetical protein
MINADAVTDAYRFEDELIADETRLYRRRHATVRAITLGRDRQ